MGDGVRDGWVQKEQGCSKNKTSDLSGTAFGQPGFLRFRRELLPCTLCPENGFEKAKLSSFFLQCRRERERDKERYVRLGFKVLALGVYAVAFLLFSIESIVLLQIES